MLESLREEYSRRGGERRASARYEFSTSIEIEWCSRKIWGRVRNVSRYGMFIELPNTSIANASFPAKIALNRPLSVECTVRRVVPGRGISVSITVPEKEARTRYEALLVALSLGSEPTATAAELPPEEYLVVGCS